MNTHNKQLYKGAFKAHILKHRNTEVHTLIMMKKMNVSGYVPKRDVSSINDKTVRHLLIFISKGSVKDPETEKHFMQI